MYTVSFWHYASRAEAVCALNKILAVLADPSDGSGVVKSYINEPPTGVVLSFDIEGEDACYNIIDAAIDHECFDPQSQDYQIYLFGEKILGHYEGNAE
jgi:hypothetical protein